MRLEGKVAIISGASGGMGAEEARLFAREGAKVVIADIIDEDGEAVAREIEDTGGEATYVHTDVTSAESWDAAVQATLDKYGKVDILVNNAGISSGSHEDPLDVDGWNSIMDVNSTGVYLGTRAVIPAMLEAGGGSIVNISSIMGFVGGEGGHPAYHAPREQSASSPRRPPYVTAPTASGPTRSIQASCPRCAHPTSGRVTSVSSSST